MGKQTRLHPLPLSVLRGALEYCGWKFKTLRWVADSQFQDYVLYKVSKLSPPLAAPRMDVHAIKVALQRCFTSQVEIAGVTHNTNTGIEVWIRVKKQPLPERLGVANGPADDLPF